MSQSGQTHFKNLNFKVCLTILGYYALKGQRFVNYTNLAGFIQFQFQFHQAKSIRYGVFFRSVYPGMSIRSPCSSRIRGNTGTLHSDTAQKVMFSIKDFFSKCDQIRRKLQMENFIFCAVWHFPCCFYFREEKSTTL